MCTKTYCYLIIFLAFFPVFLSCTLLGVCVYYSYMQLGLDNLRVKLTRISHCVKQWDANYRYNLLSSDLSRSQPLRYSQSSFSLTTHAVKSASVCVSTCHTPCSQSHTDRHRLLTMPRCSGSPSFISYSSNLSIYSHLFTHGSGGASPVGLDRFPSGSGQNPAAKQHLTHLAE